MPAPSRRVEQVAEAIARTAADVAAGLQPGDQPRFLPSWNALAREHGASKSTVQDALALLAERGVVELVPGKGARVLPTPRVQRRPAHQQTTRGRWRGLHLAASDIGLRDWVETWIEDVLLPREPAGFLGVALGTPTVERARIQGVVIAGERVPVQLSWTWFHPDVAEELPVVRQPDTGEGGIWSRFEDAGYRLVQDEVIRAAPATASQADALDVPEGGPLLEVWRTCRDDTSGRVLEVTLRLINPDLHELVFP